MILDITEILSYLPHRYPFLLIDRVLEFEIWKSLVAIKNVTINEPFFMGHFPGQPVMPGVLILEGMAQASGIVILKSTSTINHTDHLFLLAAVSDVRFKRIVIPGDQIRFKVELVREKSGLFKFCCEAMVENKLACKANLMIARRPKHD